jgi:hypothetical protein
LWLVAAPPIQGLASDCGCVLDEQHVRLGGGELGAEAVVV